MSGRRIAEAKKHFYTVLNLKLKEAAKKGGADYIKQKFGKLDKDKIKDIKTKAKEEK